MSFEKKIIFENETPFTIFKIENFLNDDLYENLRLNFPEIPKNDITDYKNLKYGFSNGSVHYKRILRENIYFRKFHNLVYSRNFFNFFYKKLFSKILKARRDSLIHFVKLLRPSLFLDESTKDLSPFKKYFFNKVKIGVSLSYIKNGGFIVPHVDGIGKLLSLMIYFPDTNLQKEKTLGTSFYNYKFKNFNNSHLQDDDLLKFNEEAKLIYKSKFEKNNLYGFIKNNLSWHTVDKIQFGDKNYWRKSININFYF